jgi:hypothetical protein
MLANCANPLCSASSGRLAEGKMFQLGIDPAIGSSKARRVDRDGSDERRSHRQHAQHDQRNAPPGWIM